MSRTVVAGLLLLLTACSSGGTPEAPPSSPNGSSEALALRAKVRGVGVELAWDGELESGQAFEVVRNGEVLSSSATESYLDGAPPLRRPVTYVVRLRQIGGDVLAESPAVRVRVPEPPLVEARLDGTYRLRGSITEASSGWESVAVGDAVHFTLTLDPTCERGSCTVNVKSSPFHVKLRFELEPAGDLVYEGDFSSRGWMCRPDHIASIGSVSLTIDEAEAANGQWVARKGTGTMSIAFPESSDCTGTLSADFAWAS